MLRAQTLRENVEEHVPKINFRISATNKKILKEYPLFFLPQKLDLNSRILNLALPKSELVGTIDTKSGFHVSFSDLLTGKRLFYIGSIQQVPFGAMTLEDIGTTARAIYNEYWHNKNSVFSLGLEGTPVLRNYLLHNVPYLKLPNSFETIALSEKKIENGLKEELRAVVYGENWPVVIEIAKEDSVKTLGRIPFDYWKNVSSEGLRQRIDILRENVNSLVQINQDLSNLWRFETVVGKFSDRALQKFLPNFLLETRKNDGVFYIEKESLERDPSDLVQNRTENPSPKRLLYQEDYHNPRPGKIVVAAVSQPTKEPEESVNKFLGRYFLTGKLFQAPWEIDVGESSKSYQEQMER